MSDITVKNGILKWEGGGCRPATDPEKDMWREIKRLREALRELEDALSELVQVAGLRGDNVLPSPPDDPLLWSARMQTAWDEAERVIGGVE